MKQLFLSLLLVSATLATTAQKPVTPELLWALQRVGGVEISPDGKTILYTVRTYDLDADKGTSRIFTLPVTGGEPAPLTSEDMSVIQATWKPDGSTIGYLAATDGRVQLFEMPSEGGHAEPMSDFDESVFNVAYSPTGNSLSFTSDVKLDETATDVYPDLPKTSGRIIDDLMFRHWDSWHDYAYSHVFVTEEPRIMPHAIDLMKDEPFDSPLQPFGGGEHIAWSPDGKMIAYVAKKMKGIDYARSTNSDIYIYNIEEKNTNNLSTGWEGYDTDPVFSPDGRYLAWLNMARGGFESDKNAIAIFDFQTGNKDVITSSIDQSFSNLIWSKDGNKLYAISGVNATYQAFEITLDKEKTKPITNSQVRQITQGEHNINSIALAGNKLIGTMNTMSKPAEIYAWDIKSGKQQQLTFHNDDIWNEAKLGKVEKRMVKTSDGKDMLTWVIYPPDFDPNKKYPTLLYCQGGPQSAVSQFFSYRWNFQLMASNGYIIVAPNRRGLPTFGQDWNDQISGDWGGQAMKDYLSAIDEIAKEPYVDKENLGAVGASYGGYSVYYLAGIHEGRFDAFISHCGLFNLESWYGSTEELFFANWDVGGPYYKEPKPASYEKFSPHSMVHKWDTPILVIHNEKDYRVPINQGIEAFNAAQQMGIPSRFLYFPDEGHWVLKPQNSVLWHREFFRWLDEHLKD